MNNQELNPKNFVLQFEAQGSTLLFQDLVIEYPYVPMDILILFGNNQVQSYIPKDLLKKLDLEGESRSVEKTKEIIDSLSNRVKHSVNDIEKYKLKIEFDYSDFICMVENLQTIAKEYFYFDPIYWNSVFEKRSSNKVFGENIKLVEGFKNNIRVELGKIYFDIDSYMQILIKRLSEKFSVSVSDLQWYLVKELADLFNNKKVSPNEISSRKNKHVLYWKPESGSVLYIDQEASDIINLFRDIKHSSTVLKGAVAHLGSLNNSIITGKAFVFIRNEFEQNETSVNLSKMEDGQILIAQTTSPELVNLIKKSSAIITDIGGMLSHAAITARELNIPCIVGTEFATKVLKDGDLVEVDIDNGIIRKI